MKDLILGFKLLRYGYKLKTNVMMLILFTAIGFVIELSSHGTNILGGFYFMLTGMFAYQMIIYMNASDYVQSSVMKRKLEVGMPVIVSTVVYLVLFTILVAEKYILIRIVFRRISENYQDTLFMIIFILFGAMIFCGVCYKYFVASFIVFMLVIITCMSTISSWLCHHHISEVISLGLVKTCCPWICGHPFGWCYRVFDQFTSLQKTVVRVCNERTQQEHEVNENTTKLNKIDGTEPVADCAGLPKRGRSQQKICNRLYCYYQVSGI